MNVIFLVLNLSSYPLMEGQGISLCIPHGQEDGLDFSVMENSRAMGTSVWPSVLPRLGKHVILNSSQAEAIT